MAKYKTLNDAMAAGDELAEAEIRYRLLAETFTDMPQLRGNMNGQLERVKAEILRLRAAEASAEKRAAPASEGDDTVVSFDAGRFRKSGA